MVPCFVVSYNVLSCLRLNSILIVMKCSFSTSEELCYLRYDIDLLACIPPTR